MIYQNIYFESYMKFPFGAVRLCSLDVPYEQHLPFSPLPSLLSMFSLLDHIHIIIQPDIYSLKFIMQNYTSFFSFFSLLQAILKEHMHKLPFSPLHIANMIKQITSKDNHYSVTRTVLNVMN